MADTSNTQEEKGQVIKLHDLRPAPGSKKAKTRVGRGEGSKGKTAGRGTKGTKARYQVRPGFEGGQMPLYRRIPKRGFTNRNTREIVAVNVSLLERFEAGSEVTAETLKQAGIVSNARDGIKILGNGELTKKLTVRVRAFSEGAKTKIEAVGGTCEVI